MLEAIPEGGAVSGENVQKSDRKLSPRGNTEVFLQHPSYSHVIAAGDATTVAVKTITARAILIFCHGQYSEVPWYHDGVVEAARCRIRSTAGRTRRQELNMSSYRPASSHDYSEKGHRVREFEERETEQSRRRSS